jgi:hypothetical protein
MCSAREASFWLLRLIFMLLPHCLQVEIKTTPQTVNPDVLQKAADFVHAFILGEGHMQASSLWQFLELVFCSYLSPLLLAT